MSEKFVNVWLRGYAHEDGPKIIRVPSTLSENQIKSTIAFLFGHKAKICSITPAENILSVGVAEARSYAELFRGDNT